MRLKNRGSPYRQRGIAMLSTTLVILVAMTVITSIVAGVAVNSQRMAANAAHADRAFQVADSGVDNALAYVNHNRAYVASTATDGWFNGASSPKWTPCAVSDIALPCGDGNANLYGVDWVAYGPVPNLLTVDADFSNDVYLLSDNINDAPTDEPWLTCMDILRVDVVESNQVSKINTITAALDLLGLSLPTNLCFPLHFNSAGLPPAPSSSNPTLRAVASSSNTADLRGGSAQVQQDLQTTSRFAWDPMAPLIVHGTPHLAGNVRVWGNPRPPSRPPYDWSILDLNDVAGLNVTSMLNGHVGSNATTLATLLNLTVDEVLALNWNVTFPLTIWSDESVSFSNSPVSLNFNDGARTCMPQFDNVVSSSCLTMSFQSVGPGLLVKMPDVQDEHNLTSTVANLLDTTAPVDFPDDLFAHLFGIPDTQTAELKNDATVLTDCTDLETKPGGLYWVTGNCSISGTVGSATDPQVLIAEGTVDMAGSSEFWGVMYMLGNSHRNIDGSLTGLRPTIFGALLSSDTVHIDNNMNIVYNRDVIRRAGYRAGVFARLPGGWTDEVTGP